MHAELTAVARELKARPQKPSAPACSDLSLNRPHRLRRLNWCLDPGEPSVLLHFLLVSATSLDQQVETTPAVVRELFRTTAPVPDLTPGRHDINLTRITFPARMPSNPPHHRSGAALYYILAGTGASTIQGRTEARGPGSLNYEPSGLVHQWGNPGDEPFTFLAFNINPEGTAAVLPAAPMKAQ